MSASDSILFSPDIPIYRTPIKQDSNNNYIPIDNDSVYLHCMNIFHTIEVSGFLKRHQGNFMNEVRNNVIEILANIKSCPSIKPPSITDNHIAWLKGFIFIQNPTQEEAIAYNEIGLIQFIDQTQICLGLLTYYEDETPKWNIRWKILK